MDSFKKDVLANIVKDDEFRAQVRETYNNAQLKRSFSSQRIDNSLVALYRSMLEKSQRYIHSGNRHLAFDLVPVERIKNQILIGAQLGLSLNPAEKELYLETDSTDCTGGLNIKSIFGIDGISLLLNSCEAVRTVASSVIYEGDHFEWYGEDASPAYTRNLKNTQNDIIGAWGRIRLVNGDVLCTLITQNEIENVTEQQVYMADQLAQDTPWLKWKDKCIRNMVIRRLFSERAKELKLIDSRVEISEARDSVEAKVIDKPIEAVSEDDFNKLIQSVDAETTLASGLNQQSA